MSQKKWWAPVALLVATSCAGQRAAPTLDERETGVNERAPVIVTGSAAPSQTMVNGDHPPSRDGPTPREVLGLIEIRRRCGRLPQQCAFGEIAVPDSPYDTALRNLMGERIRLGLRTRAGDGEFRPTVVAIERQNPGEASVHTCIFDALVVYDTKTIPGAHIVFDDLAVSILSTWSIRLHEGRWKWYSEQVTRHVLLRDACS